MIRKYFRNETTLIVSVVNDELGLALAEEILLELGYSNIRTYIEGMTQWIRLGGPVEFPKEISFEVRHELRFDF